MIFVIVSRTIGVFFFVKKELSHQSSWQENTIISPEWNVFSEVHTNYKYKSLKAYKKLYTASLVPIKLQLQCYVMNMKLNWHGLSTMFNERGAHLLLSHTPDCWKYCSSNTKNKERITKLQHTECIIYSVAYKNGGLLVNVNKGVVYSSGQPLTLHW